MNGAAGPTATPLARVLENSDPGSATIPCLEARTASATELRQLRARRLLFNHLAKAPPVQVSLDSLLLFYD